MYFKIIIAFTALSLASNAQGQTPPSRPPPNNGQAPPNGPPPPNNGTMLPPKGK